MKSSVYFITDCHFCKNYPMDSKKVDSFAKIISNDINSFIYLVISGDIANSGRSSEYDYFLDFFQSLKSKSKREIELITCPGNHDINFNGRSYSYDDLIEDTKEENVEDAFKKESTQWKNIIHLKKAIVI